MATKDQGGPSRGQETWQCLTREQEEKLMVCKGLLQTHRLQPSLGFSQLYKVDVGHRGRRGKEQNWADQMDSMFKWKRRQRDGNLSKPPQHWVLNWGEGLDTWEFSLRWSLVTYTRWSDGQSVGTETTTHLFMGFMWGLVPFPQLDLLKSLWTWFCSYDFNIHTCYMIPMYLGEFIGQHYFTFKNKVVCCSVMYGWVSGAEQMDELITIGKQFQDGQDAYLSKGQQSTDV